MMAFSFEFLNSLGCDWSIEGNSAYFKGKWVARRDYGKFESWYDKPARYFLVTPINPDLARVIAEAQKIMKGKS